MRHGSRKNSHDTFDLGRRRRWGGKTTVSAALGVVAARRDIRTLVITVDPAKRLADALGLESLDSEPRPTDAIDGMWAAMLDAQASWTKIVRKHSPPDVAERLIEHEFFEAITARFPSSQSYAAAEEMANFIDAKVWDLVIVDTPPSAGGIGFFNAPGDMSDLVGGRVLRWLTGALIPGRRAVYTVAGKPALRVLDTILEDGLLPRVPEFLMDLRTTYDGLTGHAKQIERMLKRATTVVVTTADPRRCEKPLSSIVISPKSVDAFGGGVQPGAADLLCDRRCGSRRPNRDQPQPEPLGCTSTPSVGSDSGVLRPIWCPDCLHPLAERLPDRPYCARSHAEVSLRSELRGAARPVEATSFEPPEHHGSDT